MVQVTYCPVMKGGQEPTSCDCKIVVVEIERTAVAKRRRDTLFHRRMSFNGEREPKNLS